MQDIESLFYAACRADIEALKPGNVGLHGAGHGMDADMFEQSAKHSAPVLCRKDHIRLGTRILGSLRTLQDHVACNTNLGIVLLCAPLIHAHYARAPQQSLRDALREVLEQTTVQDACDVYQAIAVSQAGNLGRVADQDIASTPTVTLKQAMCLASDWDLVAKQYCNDFEQVFRLALPALLEFRNKWGHNNYAVTGVFLMLLAEYPDSLVARKFGLEAAEQVRCDAEALYAVFSKTEEPGEFTDSLLGMDQSLKQKGFNPGTTADLVVASILAANLDEQ